MTPQQEAITAIFTQVFSALTVTELMELTKAPFEDAP